MRTVKVKPDCALGDVQRPRPVVHDAYMIQRITKRPPPGARLRPLYQRTYIKQWREYREMSQEELAEAVGEYLSENGISEKGYTHASIGRIENGRMPYSQPIMEGISQALRVPVATLITVPPPEDGQPIPPDPAALLRMWKEGVRSAGNSPPSAIPGMRAKRSGESR
jgi:transcriptional regulator with XRE-family HTH domain